MPSLVQIMTWRRQSDKALSEPMMAGLLTHICVTRPQRVKSNLSITYCWVSRQVHGNVAIFSFYMMTSSNGHIFRATGHLCGELPATGEFLAQRLVTRSFDVFLDLRLGNQLSKQSRGWWFETPSRPLWRHCWSTAVLCNNITLATRMDVLEEWEYLYFSLFLHL